MSVNIESVPKDRVIVLYSDDIEEEFISGYIVACSGEDFILACIDGYGEYNGFLWLRTDRVYRVDYDSEYEKKIGLLYRLKKQKHPVIDNISASESLMDTLLSWAYRSVKAVKFKYDVKDVCGFLCDPVDCRVAVIDQYECKPDQGYAVVDPACADVIWADEKRIRDAGLIYAYRGGERDV